VVGVRVAWIAGAVAAALILAVAVAFAPWILLISFVPSVGGGTGRLIALAMSLGAAVAAYIVLVFCVRRVRAGSGGKENS
jgi:hypothetical protein